MINAAALRKGRRVLYREDYQFLADKPDLAQVAVPLIASSLVCLEVLPGLIVRRATHRPVSLEVVVVRLND